MEGQYIYSLDVAKAGGEIRHAADFSQIIRPARHQHETNPDGPFTDCKAARERQNRFIRLTRQPHVQIGCKSFDIEENQINQVQITITEPLSEPPISVERRMHSSFLRAGENI